MSKTVLITGTSSGFGKRTTQFLAEKGYRVYATMRNTKSKNAEMATELDQLANVTVLDLDVTDKESVNKAVENVISKEGVIDVLINNAAFTVFGITESFTEEDFKKLIDVNLMGPWLLIQSVLPYMRKQNDGLIINMSSGAGRFSVPFCSMYSSTKFAIEGLVEGLYFELKQLGIESILIEPGNFATGLQTKMKPGSNAKVIAEYGEVARIPDKIGESMLTYFQSGQAPDTVLIAEKILELIETDKGERPLRSVVDPTPMGIALEKVNEVVEEQSKEFIKAFGI